MRLKQVAYRMHVNIDPSLAFVICPMAFVLCLDPLLVESYVIFLLSILESVQDCLAPSLEYLAM